MMELKNIIYNHCPNIVSIIGEKSKFWKKVESVYLERLKYIKEEVKSKKAITLRKSFIDNLITQKNERIEAIAFMKHLDYKVKVIYDSFKDNQKLFDKFRQILEQLVLPEKVEPKSNDRIAEIFSIDYLLSSNSIKILELEYELENKKSIDCLIKSEQNERTFLIDFYSINVDASKAETPELFGKFLANRIIKKYMSKTKNIKELEYPFRIFPIIWLNGRLSDENMDYLSNSETMISTEFYILKGIENITDKTYNYLFGTINELKYWG